VNFRPVFRSRRLLLLPLLSFFLAPLFAAEEAPVEFVLKDAVWRHPDADRLPAYWDFVRAQGYTGVAFEIVEPSGLLHCFSPTLKSLGWDRQIDRLGPLLKAMPDLDRPERRLKIWIDLSAFSRHAAGVGKWPDSLRRPSPEDSGQIAADLQEYYAYDELLTEPMTPETQSVLFWTAKALRKKLGLFAVSPALERWAAPPSGKKEERELQHRFVSRDTRTYPLKAGDDSAVPDIGLGDLAFALARSQGKDAWAACGAAVKGPPGFEHNLLVYRAAQYAPKGFIVVPGGANDYIYDADRFDFGRKIRPDLLRFRALALEKNRARVPVANLVLGAQGRGPALPNFIEPVLNALLANGYDVRVTFDELLPRADLYYVANSEDWLYNLPFFRKLLDLLNEKKSRFYGPVILHPTGAISDRGPWAELRAFFKIPDSETGWMDDLPDFVDERGRKIGWKSTVEGESGMTSIRSQLVRANYGEVFLAQHFRGRELALILRNGNRFLINGNFLHLESAYILSKLMQGALQAPAMAYVTSGRFRTAALALADTALRLKVPVQDPADFWTITVFDASGRLVQEETLPGRETLDLNLKSGDLAVVRQEYR
jgi:hypothetical protein